MFAQIFMPNSLRAISIGFLGLVMAISVGCAKSPEEKAKSQADDAITTLKTNANAVDAMGTPKETWSDADLSKYEGLLNALDRDADKIETLNGKDGVIITGTWKLDDLRRIVRHNRGVLQDARANRKKLVVAEHHDKLLQYQNQEVKKFVDLGVPADSWSKEELLSYRAAIEKIESRQGELDSLRADLRIASTPENFYKTLRDLKASVDEKLKSKGF